MCWCRNRYLNDIWERYRRPIWLTELACPNEKGPLSRQISFMRGALKVLDEDDAVERCAADPAAQCRQGNFPSCLAWQHVAPPVQPKV